ncbi:fumarylacetoacetate hydrolase family protein [Paenibacillus favisporus]|uniref:fumarylacetoacetate hydrolase family protein n=1 Tax=Paenibacillus favisporus TaxID=221028 RepID=UPI0013D0DF2C|nr:fumarylacetoacetate hydrolase family protein [Paenibacillus favisporus]
MKLLTYLEGNTYRLGVATEVGIVDVAAALGDGPGPRTVHEVIEGGEEAIRTLQQAVNRTLASCSDVLLGKAGLKLGPCVTHPNKIICVGLNYRKHAEETNAPIPEYPILFSKFSNTLAADGEDVPLPRTSQKVDYEAELVIVIGKTAKYVAKEEALDYVFGYCAANDLSARDLQMRTQQWLLGKSCDKFSPIGPYLVTADEVGDPNALDIKCIVNGEVRQHSNTSDMIFRCDEIVSYISHHMTLVPGDIVSINIEKLGSLTNRMISE